MVSKKNGLDIENGDVLESVGKFCYLGDLLNADGGADSPVVARVRCAWKKFRELNSSLTLFTVFGGNILTLELYSDGVILEYLVSAVNRLLGPENLHMFSKKPKVTFV